MKYLRLRITSDDHVLLYEKDVEAANAFEGFVRELVARLVSRDEIASGDHYAALVIPRYGETLLLQPVRSIDKARASEPLDWIELVYQEAITPDQPVRFFTIELRVRESGLIYRQDFLPAEVSTHFVGYGVEQALLSLGVLESGQIYRPIFFAHDDSDFDFEREHIPALQASAEALIEFVSDEPEAPAFPHRAPTFYTSVEQVGQTQPDDVQIYIRRGVLDRLHTEAKVSETVERGGILVGNVYTSTDGGRYIVEISDYIVSEGTLSTETELTYTFESWQSHQAQLREQFPGKRIVGWYHTHLIEMQIKIEGEPEVHGTTMFFSQHDVFMHSQFFRDEWYVALVLDPWGSCQFFQWKRDRIVPCPGYRIFDDLGVAG